MVAWSGGKDACWALHRVKEEGYHLPVGLFASFDSKSGKVPFHGVPASLLKSQARSLGLPIDLIDVGGTPSNAEYEKAIGAYFDRLAKRNIYGIIYGDVFLEDVRDYKIELCKKHGLETFFPLWGEKTENLAMSMILAGLRAVVCSVDPQQVNPIMLGHPFDAQFINSLKADVDPCGENGEYHTFVVNAEGFRFPIDIMHIGRSQRKGMEMLEIFPYDRNVGES
jgi:uncharacterized protein (TIGR00290 family)